MHKVNQYLETNSYIWVLMIHFSKASDVVNHAILIPNLTALGISNNIVNLITSFLSDRRQTCIIKFNRLKPANINISIIQGSGLGPTLYVIMEGDLKPNSAINTIFKYADDTNLMVLENTDVRLLEWCDNNKKLAEINSMHINLAKTKEIVIVCLTHILILIPHFLTPQNKWKKSSY